VKKKWLSIVGIILLISVATISYSVSTVNGQINSPKEYEIQQINADNTQALKLDFEQHHSVLFEVNSSNNANQDNFNVDVSNVASGKYKVLITATNDYTYESDELNHDVTLPIIVESDVTYKITVISTSSEPFLADVNITSKEIN
jgi:uncharacterized protein YpmB